MPRPGEGGEKEDDRALMIAPLTLPSRRPGKRGKHRLFVRLTCYEKRRYLSYIGTPWSCRSIRVRFVAGGSIRPPARPCRFVASGVGRSIWPAGWENVIESLGLCVSRTRSQRTSSQKNPPPTLLQKVRRRTSPPMKKTPGRMFISGDQPTRRAPTKVPRKTIVPMLIF